MGGWADFSMHHSNIFSTNILYYLLSYPLSLYLYYNIILSYPIKNELHFSMPKFLYPPFKLFWT